MPEKRLSHNKLEKILLRDCNKKESKGDRCHPDYFIRAIDIFAERIREWAKAAQDIDLSIWPSNWIIVEISDNFRLRIFKEFADIVFESKKKKINDKLLRKKYLRAIDEVWYYNWSKWPNIKWDWEKNEIRNRHRIINKIPIVVNIFDDLR